MNEIILNIDSVSYSSNLNEERVKNKIENLFKKGNSSFIGKFTNKNEFTAYDKWTIIGWAMPNLKRKSAYLKGKIITSEKGISLSLDFKPNTILSIFSIISILMGITLTIISKTNNQYLMVGLILITVGVVYYTIGFYLRNRLRKNFEKGLNLSSF